MGLHPIPLGLSAQVMFGDERSAGGSALMDMSVGSGANSKGNSSGSRGSGRSKSSGSRGRSHSPASIDKGALKTGQEHLQCADDGRDQPPPDPVPMAMYGQDFKFTWDGKRRE